MIYMHFDKFLEKIKINNKINSKYFINLYPFF